MSDKTKVKVAFASAIVRQLWIEGLISKNERENMEEKSRKALIQANC